MDSRGQGLSLRGDRAGGHGAVAAGAAHTARTSHPAHSARTAGNSLVLPSGVVQALMAPVRVRVVRGTLWLTVDGEPADIVLEPGDCHTIAAARRVLACALGGEVAFDWTQADAAPERRSPDAVGVVGAGLGGLKGLVPAPARLASWARRLRRAWLAPGAGA